MGLWERFTKDPFGFITRGLYKTIIGPLKYGGRDGYDAARYWRDRFLKHGPSLKAVGDEGLSHAENARVYAQAGNVFAEVCRSKKLLILRGPGCWRSVAERASIPNSFTATA